MLFVPVPYYKLNKGFFLGFLFKPLGGLRPPRGLNKTVSEKYPLFITYYMPSTFYIVKLPLALGNIFNWTESIMAQSHDDAKIHIGASLWIFGTAS